MRLDDTLHHIASRVYNGMQVVVVLKKKDIPTCNRNFNFIDNSHRIDVEKNSVYEY